MTELGDFLFRDHWLAGNVFLPWIGVIWNAAHGEWLRLGAVLLYIEMIGGPFVLLK